MAIEARHNAYSALNGFCLGVYSGSGRARWSHFGQYWIGQVGDGGEVMLAIHFYCIHS